MKEPHVQVGILSEKQIRFVLPNPHQAQGSYCQGVVTHCKTVSGEQEVTYDNGQIRWDGQSYDSLTFIPLDYTNDAFELKDVTIGIHFHWERKENQRFQGALKFVPDDGKLIAVNVIYVEDYLTSVISSEMSATASPELLKAHAVISRSWLLSQMKGNRKGYGHSSNHTAFSQTDTERIRWFDKEDHTLFDVCADDHCQRYQGITRASTEQVREAIAATRGQVLTYNGKICDARYSKCCGGALEEFQYCWEDIRHPYLAFGVDKGTRLPEERTPDLTQEAEADRWIRTSPEAFCNTTDKRILSQVLNNYDQETTDFYRWKVEYTQEKLAALIKERSGEDYGQIIDLVPVARGTSGRIWKLKIVGTKKTLILGKELEIRRTLSTSHLYSSAFVVDKEGSCPVDKDALAGCSVSEVPARFILTGAGWGHGVGLCQIGAAMMGEQGYPYDKILLHYYTGARIDTLYE